MKKINNILWKLLSVLVAILTNTAGVFADDDATEDSSSKTGKFFFCGSDKKNYYVKKCGNYDVGIDWLRTVTTIDGEIKSVFITNSDSFADNLSNFKRYINNAGTTNKTIFSNANVTADANEQLERLCSPYVNGIQNSFECAPCPNAGILDDKPSVTINYNDKSIVANTWKFYTIADCFLQEFSDNTGTFYYTDYSYKNVQHCYYNPNSSEITGTMENIQITTNQNISDEE